MAVQTGCEHEGLHSASTPQCVYDILFNSVHVSFIFQGLLLLIQLTKGNANIQKIVVFENAFEKLLEIVGDEGMSDGGKLSLIQTLSALSLYLPSRNYPVRVYLFSNSPLNY